MDIQSISARAVLKIAALVFGVAIALRFLWIAHAIFIITFLGAIIGLALARAVDYLERIHIRRGIGAPLIMLIVVGMLTAGGAALAPMIQQQSRQLSKEMPRALEKIEQWLNGRVPDAIMEGVAGGSQSQPNGSAPSASQPQGAATAPSPDAQRQQAGSPGAAQQNPQQTPGEQANPQSAAQQAGARQQSERAAGGRDESTATGGDRSGNGSSDSPRGLRSQLGAELRGLTKYLFPVVSSVIGALAGLVIVLFIAMYVAARPRVYREGILHLVPHRMRSRADEVLAALSDTLRQWLIARLIAMIAIALITGGGLMALGIEGAIALGIIAGLLEFIPFFGPIIAALPAIGIALVESPEKALWVAALYLLVQQLEGNLITPLLLQQRLEIPPILTVVSVAALGTVFGVLGMLIAEPILAVILVTTKMLYVNDVVGDDVSVGKAG